MQNFLPRSLVSLALIALALSLSLKAGFVPLVRVGAQNVKRTPASRAATHTQGEADDGDGTVRPYTGGGLFISEYRLEGPNGATDEFIEIYNDENSPVTVNAPSSTGYALVASDGVVRCILPNNTVIPSRGHYLCANSNGYSLNNYPAGSNMTAIPDASYTTDIPLNSGIALFNTANPVDFTLANRIDAVGTTSAPTLYREGAGHPVISSTTTEFSLFRLLDATGTPQDTDDNETDFLIADTQGTNLCTSTANFKCQRLGAPGPENLTSPTFTPGTISISLLDPAAAATAPPNQITDSIPDPANNATFGSLLYRRKITNNTGQPLTRLRFRVKKLSTFPPSTGEADLRLRTITDTTANTSNGPVFVEGTTLETPPAQPNGGGYNSTVVVGSISAANPLPPGASINVQFLLGIQQTGTYTFETDFGQISAPPTTITASNTNDSGAGSLRQAILDANAQPGTQTIAFNIGSGLQTINLLSALPTITDPLIIDGTTQPGYSGTPLIELNGLSTGVVSGLVITSGNSQVKGLIINRFSNLGIILQTGGGNIVEGNFIGTNAAGTATLGNNSNGVGIIDSANNTIGGTAAAARNVISGNGGDGIGISGASSTGNIIQGNFIGTDAAGTSAIPNARSAVAIGGASNNVVGGTSAGARNVLSGNTQNGVIIFSGGSGTSIQGNFIGTNASGTAGLPNGGEGIFVMGGSSNNTIGGTTAAARNIISGNNSNGISFRDNGTNNNAVVGNYIGTDVSGTASIRNLFAGIVFGNNATGNTVGGTAAGAGNVISGNSGTGVQIGVFGSGPGGGITVQGNLIGTNAAGTAALGNGGYGVSVDNTPNNQIGGTAAGARNVISGNTFVNVYIIGANAAGNTVAGNYVGTNAAGTSGLGGSGVLLGNGANNNTVGGTTAAARNVVSGNAANGVALGGGDNNVSTNNRVQGNYIGLNAAGTAVVTNTFSGVSLTGTGATNNLIGGTAAGAGNVIAGNSHQAVAILNGASGNTIQGNFMGTDATGNTGLGGEGVFIGGGSSNNLIGGTTAAARNVMSGNTGAAVSINDFNGGGATNNRVEGNFIGVNPAGTNAVPNGGGGIIINNVSGNTVGGLAAGAGNVIANNTPFGVRINSGSANAILSNSIFNNGDAGIGLTNGGNDSQAAPVLTAAMNVSGTMTITGTLTSTPNSSFTVQFFSNAACDASGSGEGQTFLGTTSVTTSAGGTAPISFVAGNVPAGQLITATATSAANSTSQFSACRIVTSQDFTISGRITDPAGNGLSDVTVTLSGAGAQNVKTDANGNYSFVVVGGQSYTVTPTSPYFVFTPLRADFANIASSQAANFSVVPTATPTPTPPLQDDFNAAQRDPDKWNLGTLTQPAAAFDPQVSVTQQSGQLSITPRDGVQAASFNGYVSVKSFDFTGGRVSVEAVKAAGGGAETAFAIGSDAQNNFRFAVMPFGAAPQHVRAMLAARLGGWEKLAADMLVLVFQVKIAGVVTQQAIPYDPVQLRYWRFRHDPPQNSILFETSPDNAAYVERFRKTLEKGVSALAVELTAGTTAPATGSTNAVFDNLSLISANAQFSTDVTSAGEGDGRLSVTVTRSGNVAGNPATLTYQTEDTDTFTVGCFDTAGNRGSAYARCDFATTVGTLSFAAGETTKTFTVPLIDDGFAEGTETFNLKLVNATGAALGAPSLIRVSILDNDAAGAANPVTTSFPFFVRQQYLDFLSREPDTGGFDAWLGVLNNCPNANVPPSVPSGCDRIYVSGEGFFRSAEFQLKGFYVFRFYKVAFNRLPEYLEVVSDMSFVAGLTAEEVYARKAQLATLITERAEFKTLYGNMTDTQYVSALMSRYGVQQVTTPDPAQPDGAAKVTLSATNLTDKLASRTMTRAQVLRAIADSDAVGTQEFNNAFVGMQYYGYLRRKPDPEGFAGWLRVLQSGDVRTMVNGFLNSVEYKLRFGQP